jgi:hypothetical protein
MIAALIQNNIVTNLIMADAAFHPAPEGYVMVNVDQNNHPQIGSAYDPATGGFTPPYVPPAPIVVPGSVTPRQVRLILLQQGLLDQIEAMIAEQDRATQITWQFASEFRRDDPLLAQLAATLGLTDEQVDNFFIAAARL